MTDVFDDHGTSDTMDTELHLDYPVLPPQQSLDDHNFVPLITLQHQILQRNKTMHRASSETDSTVQRLGYTLPPTTVAPFRLSGKTLDTLYVHKHSSPSLLTSIQSALMTPLVPPPTVLPSNDDNDPLPESGPLDYSRSTPDPMHRGVVMCHVLSPLWLLVKKAEMDDLIKRNLVDRETLTWMTVKHLSLQPDDHIFSTRFHNKIKRKNGAFEYCKVRLVVQGQHMQKKDASGSGDFEDSFSSVTHDIGLCLMLTLATQHNMFTDHVDISQAFVQGDLCLVMTTLVRYTYLPPQATLRTLKFAICSVNLCMGCPEEVGSPSSKHKVTPKLVMKKSCGRIHPMTTPN